MVSMYTSSIVSSLTTRLELTLEMLGVITSPMDIVPTGISQPTSMTSGVFQAGCYSGKASGAEWVATLMPMLLVVGEMPVVMGPSINRVVGL